MDALERVARGRSDLGHENRPGHALEQGHRIAHVEDRRGIDHHDVNFLRESQQQRPHAPRAQQSRRIRCPAAGCEHPQAPVSDVDLDKRVTQLTLVGDHLG